SDPVPARFSPADDAAWYARLPTMVGAAAALFTNPAGRVLLVKPNYRDHWSLPGGILDHGEPPHEGCRREVKEELGLDIVPGALLVIGWRPPTLPGTCRRSSARGSPPRCAALTPGRPPTCRGANHEPKPERCGRRAPRGHGGPDRRRPGRHPDHRRALRPRPAGQPVTAARY